MGAGLVVKQAEEHKKAKYVSIASSRLFILVQWIPRPFRHKKLDFIRDLGYRLKQAMHW